MNRFFVCPLVQQLINFYFKYIDFSNNTLKNRYRSVRFVEETSNLHTLQMINLWAFAKSVFEDYFWIIYCVKFILYWIVPLWIVVKKTFN